MGTPVIIGALVGLAVLSIVNLALTLRIRTGEKKNMLDLSKLTATVELIAAIVPNLAADYETLKGEITALKAQLDPDAQAAIDALVAKMDASFVALKGLDETVPAPVVVPPVVPVVEPTV